MYFWNVSLRGNLFWHLGDFWQFFGGISSQNNCKHFGLSFSKAVFLHFQLNNQFQNVVCCKYLEVSKVVRCWCFRISNWALMLIFVFPIVLASFSKSWVTFFQSSGHPDGRLFLAQNPFSPFQLLNLLYLVFSVTATLLSYSRRV